MNKKLHSDEQPKQEIASRDQLKRIESLLDEKALVVIKSGSSLMRENSETSQRLNRLFDDLGAVMLDAAAIAEEKAAFQRPYQRALREIAFMAEGLNSFTTEKMRFQRCHQKEKKFRNKGDEVFIWRADGITSAYQAFQVRVFIRPRAFFQIGRETFRPGLGLGWESRDARLTMQIEDKQTGASLNIRIDPWEKREIIYDLEAEYLGRIDFSDAGQLQIDNKPSHHFRNPMMLKLTANEFAEALELLEKHIEGNLAE